MQMTEIDVEIQARVLLNRLGVPTPFTGYKMLGVALTIAHDCTEANCSLSKEIYPVVAKRFKSTLPRVERNIRHAIRETWVHGNRDELRELFPMCTRANPPMNRSFIARLALELQVVTRKVRGDER